MSMVFILLALPPGLVFFLPHDSKLPYACSAQCVSVCSKSLKIFICCTRN